MTYNKKDIYRKLAGIVAPIAFQYLMGSLVTASDAFMLGFLDQDSLSASSLAGQIAFVFCLFYLAFVGRTKDLVEYGIDYAHFISFILPGAMARGHC